MFEWIIDIFNIALYKPLFNSLVVLYNNIPGHDLGIAIILLTFIIRVILYPLSLKAVKSQTALQKLQPKMKEIQAKFKNDKEKQAKETLELYKQEKINPFSGLLLALIQLPILIALYRVFWTGLNPSELSNLYSFVFNPVKINFIFLHVLDLSKPSMYMAVVAGVLQFFQTKMLLPKEQKVSGKVSEFSDIMQKQMTYFFPFFTIIILLGLPSALGLYWVASSIFAIAQQYFILKNKKTTT
jgi:YidC/Oxa1 family membrane protein insertase